MSRALNVESAGAWEAHVRREKRAEALASDGFAAGFAPGGGFASALPGGGVLARARAHAADADPALTARWQGTAYAADTGATSDGGFAFRGALQRSLLPAVAGAHAAGAADAGAAHWRAGPSPLTGYSSASLARPAPSALRPLPLPIPSFVAALLPLAALRSERTLALPVRVVPLGSRAARAERDAAAALAFATKALAAYDERAEAVRRRGATWGYR
ncbi:hypothetical protein T492DRAFT_967418 [Pavlovales sp. CCMP2436]|nr:hypothetical protein T492DRAFT_967418 [Pavlovales sp. CCMP2436]